MRIRVIRKPTQPSIDGVRLDQFYPGGQYDVGTLLGAVMLAEGWAEPSDSTEPAFATFALTGVTTPPRNPPNLVREIFPLIAHVGMRSLQFPGGFLPASQNIGYSRWNIDR